MRNAAQKPVIYYGIYQKQEYSMQRTAKLFRNGRSQAVRLPSDFRFEGSEVFIRKDSATGNVILSRRPHSSWNSFIKLRDQIGVLDDFMSERVDGPPQKRKLFG
jgi:antitoxin VapB